MVFIVYYSLYVQKFKCIGLCTCMHLPLLHACSYYIYMPHSIFNACVTCTHIDINKQITKMKRNMMSAMCKGYYSFSSVMEFNSSCAHVWVIIIMSQAHMLYKNINKKIWCPTGYTYYVGYICRTVSCILLCV